MRYGMAHAIFDGIVGAMRINKMKALDLRLGALFRIAAGARLWYSWRMERDG